MDVYDKLSSLILYMYNHKLSITFVINWKNILHLKKKIPNFSDVSLSFYWPAVSLLKEVLLLIIIIVIPILFNIIRGDMNANNQPLNKNNYLLSSN